MFDIEELRETGFLVDPRDVPPPMESRFARTHLPRYAEALSASTDGLSESDQLGLLEQLSSCAATLEWRQCRAASSLALKDAATERSRAPTDSRVPGTPVLRVVGGQGTPEISELIATEIAVVMRCSVRHATDLVAVGLDLRYRLVHTNADFAAGRLGFAQAKVISEALRECTTDLAVELDPLLAEAALSRSPARLRVYARRLVARRDASALRRRQEAAHQSRNVAMFPIGDGAGAFCLNHDLTVLAAVAD